MKKVLVPGFLFLCLISCRKPTSDRHQYAGHYRMTGTIHSWAMLDTTDHPPILVDTIVEIYNFTKTTMAILGYALPYDANSSSNSADVYKWEWNYHNYKRLIFTKPFNDSAYYSSQSGGLGSGASMYLRGKKIY